MQTSAQLINWKQSANRASAYWFYELHTQMDAVEETLVTTHVGHYLSLQGTLIDQRNGVYRPDDIFTVKRCSEGITKIPKVTVYVTDESVREELDRVDSHLYLILIYYLAHVGRLACGNRASDRSSRSELDLAANAMRYTQPWLFERDPDLLVKLRKIDRVYNYGSPEVLLWVPSSSAVVPKMYFFRDKSELIMDLKRCEHEFLHAFINKVYGTSFSVEYMKGAFEI